MIRIYAVACLAVLLMALIPRPASTVATDGEGVVLTWATDGNPLRLEHVQRFQAWLDQRRAAGEAIPPITIDIRPVGYDVTPRMLGNLTGHAYDLVENAWYLPAQRRLVGTGMYAPLDDLPGIDQMAPGVQAEITDGATTFAYPANISTGCFWVNRTVLAEHGIEVPAGALDCDRFEALGTAYVAARRAAGTTSAWFVDQVSLRQLLRSHGASAFNETMTGPGYPTAATTAACERFLRWHRNGMIPTPAERQALVTRGGWNDVTNQLADGTYALISGGRWQVTSFRAIDHLRGQAGLPALDLLVLEPPHDPISGFRTALLNGRAISIARDCAAPAAARLFLSYLTTADYNRFVIDSGDALPPNPAYWTADHLRPMSEQERGRHLPWATAARSIAIGNEYSPYCSPATESTVLAACRDGLLAGTISPETAADYLRDHISQAIEQELRAHPELRQRWRKDHFRQDSVDRMRERLERAAGARADGRIDQATWQLLPRLPANLIDNPVLRAYYGQRGWLAEPADG